MTKLLKRCPTCGGNLEIREVHCLACATDIRAHYEAGPFDMLSTAQVTFLELFIHARGNMRTLEQALGVSYPTVRSRIDTLAATLRAARPEAAARISQATGLPPSE